MITDSQSRPENDSGLREFYRNRKVLIAGADGFLGINCVHALRNLQADLTVLTRRDTPRANGHTGRILRGDLRNPAFAKAAVRDQNIIFNFVGGNSAVESNRQPEKDLAGELCANLTLFEACATSATAPLVVFCSTRLVYGKPKYLPVDENHPLDPQSIYAVHKVTAEHYLKVFWTTRGLRSVIIRLSNPYGPHQSPDARNYGIINRFFQNAGRNQPIVIYGDGKQRRDYAFVKDVIHVFLLCAMNPACHGEIFNLGGHKNISIAEAAELISTTAGGTPVQYVPWPEQFKIVETGDYETDMSKLGRYLALPQGHSLEQGFKETLRYYQELE